MTAEMALTNLGRVVRREAYPYRTSWPLEELAIVTAEGAELRVLLKQLGGADVMKPSFIVDPAREPAAYRILEHADLDTPRCYAAAESWIVIEKVPGVELWQCDGGKAWQASAGWAAQLHAAFQGREPASDHLLRHDEAYYRRWVNRARTLVGEAVDPLLPAADAAIRRLTSLPTTFIHGELYASNIIIAGERVAAIDWEMAAIGPGVIDLAALLTGWTEEEQASVRAAYGEVAPADVAAARLLLAFQWLGWMEGWEAPAEHRRDWLAEAHDAAEMLS